MCGGVENAEREEIMKKCWCPVCGIEYKVPKKEPCDQYECAVCGATLVGYWCRECS